MAESDATPSAPHVAILCSPGMGHLIPLATFANLLSAHHHISVTFITHSTGHSAAHNSIISSLPQQVTVISIPPSPPTITTTTKAEARITSAVQSSLPHHRSTLRSLSSTAPLSALIFDFFYLDALDIAADLRIPSYLLLTTNCFCHSFALHLPALDASFPGLYRHLSEPLVLPGCVPLRGRDFPDPLHDRSDEGCRHFLRLVNRLGEVKGFLVNTFDALEPRTIKALKENPNPSPNLPPVYTIGPLVDGDGRGAAAECLNWLDSQPAASVVYVSFGSGGTLSSEQMIELAWGLEESSQRFLWVVRAPDDNEPNAAFFSGAEEVGSADELSCYLPDGFINRTRERGLVVASWAPQMKVLEHGATGGFLTHCGWNSSLESIVNGVPMIAWPLHAEQRMNAVMLAEGAKVAMRVEEGEGGLVGRGDIAGLVRELMEGEEGKRLRERVGVLSEEARRALGEGGSSWKNMAEVAGKWRGDVEEDGHRF